MCVHSFFFWNIPIIVLEHLIATLSYHLHAWNFLNQPKICSTPNLPQFILDLPLTSFPIPHTFQWNVWHTNLQDCIKPPSLFKPQSFHNSSIWFFIYKFLCGPNANDSGLALRSSMWTNPYNLDNDMDSNMDISFVVWPDLLQCGPIYFKVDLIECRSSSISTQSVLALLNS